MSSRSSVLNPRSVRTSSPSASGQTGPAPSSMCPASSSAMIWSCSPPVSSRGGSVPVARACSPTIWKASEVAVRASGPTVGTPMRRAIRSRRRVAEERDAVSASTSSVAYPRPSTRSASASTRVVVFPVPGAPRTPADSPSDRVSTRRWESSRTGSIGSPAAVGRGRKPRIVMTRTVPASADRERVAAP